MAKTQFLAFEIHLNDPARVAALQATPPGATILQGTVKGISRAPLDAATEFASEPNGDGTPLPFENAAGTPPHLPGKPYIYSAWFTAGNPEWSKLFPVDVATFTRKSGGWFGIPFLFPSKTIYHWRGVFVYDAPQTQDGTASGSPTTACAVRRWIDPFFGNLAATPAAPAASEQEYSATRDASRSVDGFGLGLRGMTGVRQHSLTDYSGGGGSTENLSWERLYIRWRKAGATAQTFWSGWGTAGASIRAELQITPSGQIAVYNVDAAGTYFLLGSTTALTLGKFVKLDIVIRFARTPVNNDGAIWIYLDGAMALTAVVPDGVGLGAIGYHAKSTIGTPAATGWTGELDIGFWMNAAIPYVAGVVKLPIVTGTDFKAGSRAVLVRARGDSLSRANWTGDWRTLSAIPVRTLNTGDTLKSTTALARLAVKTDVLQALNAVNGSLGCVGMVVCTHGYKGTNNGQLGYSLNGAADVMKNITAADLLNNEGASINARTWATMMYSPNPGVTPTPITDLELVRIKGNDAVESGTDHLSAVAELIGTFNDEDYDPSVDPTLRNPLPFLGVHNAPYPRTPWATAITPPMSPVIIKSGTYAGTGTFVDLFFRAPVHWLWIEKTTNLGTQPIQARWWSSMIGADLGGRKSPEPWVVPVQEIDPSFVPPAPGVGGDDFDLHTAVIEGSALDIADWPITETITRIQEDPVGGFNITPNPVLPGSWKWPFAGDGSGDNVQYTVWAFVKVGGVWHGAAFIQMWQGRSMTDGSLPAIFTNNGYKNWWGDVRHLWGTMSDYVPVAGDQIGFLLQAGNGRLRGDVTSVKERSNVLLVTLPADDTGDLGGGTNVQEAQAVIRIAGANVEVNAVGETYQYVAVSDPGQRFMLNGAVAHHDVALPSIDSLIHANFTPVAAFLFDQRPGVDGALTEGYKGPGHAATEFTRLDAAGTTVAAAVTFGAGTLTVDTGFSPGTDTHLVYNLWRRDDGSGDPGVTRVLQAVSYVGNGVSPRSINLTPASLRRPLLAVVVPHGAKPYLKHPGHTGGNSSGIDGAHVATAIISGDLDLIIVGATLNANGVAYDVFVLVGGTTAGADGFSQDGEFIPVEPTSPPGGGAFGADPEAPMDAPGTGEVGGDTPGAPGGGNDDIDTDLAAACVPFTKRVFNDALSRIGISKRIVNAATDNTEEADLCRQHYARSIEQTLRDFPWPFATRYAALTLLSGSPSSPVNRDWTYAYRRPSDCVFERRLAVVREGAVDPTPPPMQLSSDGTGGRILTNQASAQLEYTARPACTAGLGDPLFLDALTWRLASRISGPLTRIADVGKHCLDQYDAKIAKAFEVLRPGNPGPRTTVDPLVRDPGVGALAANVAVVNRALLRIGARTIANLDTEQSREAESARLIFEDELQSTLRDYSWAFATRYVKTPTLIGGTSLVPFNDAWSFAYRYPTDAVKIRRIVTETRQGFDPNPEMFRIGGDSGGRLVYTNRETPTFEYTARIPNAVQLSDTLFRDAFAWRLAACLAPSLATVDPGETEQLGRGPQDRPRERKATESQLRERATARAWSMYYRVLSLAEATDANEQSPTTDPGDAPWIRDRN